MLYNKQNFAALTGGVDTADVAPVITVDVVSNLVANLDTFRKLLGVTDMRAVAEGSQLKLYKTTLTSLANQVDENQTIALTEVKRVLAKTIDISLKKYRKLVSAEAIQQSGLDAAVNDTDAKLVSEIQKDIKGGFFTALTTGATAATAGADLQAACANAWGALSAKFEDIDATPVFFINPLDAAAYLGAATVTMQTAFGISYLENFLGLGTAIITASVTAGTVVATASENIRGAFVPANGAVGNAFGLYSDATGLVGMTHTAKTDSASIETMCLSGVAFYPEDVSGVFTAAISSGETTESESDGE